MSERARLRAATAWLLFYGHAPEAIDEMPYRDVQTFLALLPVMQARHQYPGQTDT